MDQSNHGIEFGVIKMLKYTKQCNKVTLEELINCSYLCLSDLSKDNKYCDKVDASYVKLETWKGRFSCDCVGCHIPDGTNKINPRTLSWKIPKNCVITMVLQTNSILASCYVYISSFQYHFLIDLNFDQFDYLFALSSKRCCQKSPMKFEISIR